MTRVLALLLGLVLGLLLAVPAMGQMGPMPDEPGRPVVPTGGADGVPAAVGAGKAEIDPSKPLNPLEIIGDVANLLPGGLEGKPAGETTGGERPKGQLSTAINVLLVLTVITLVPSIMLMCTCFLRIVVVLGLLKQALGTQQMPPSQVMLGLALIMTMLVMAPTVDRINREAVAPYRAGAITDYDKLWDAAKNPLKDFMLDQIEATGNSSSLYMVMNYRGLDTSDPSRLKRKDVDMVTLVPAFVLSELKVAFLMGFRIMLPFLVIDLVISAILIAMNMMMLPPVLISLPFKLLLFVMVDGWQLVVGTLMRSFQVSPPPAPPPGVVAVVEHANALMMQVT